jgi:FlaA1/EpsC-like NDP-sugar epimerase
MGGTARTAKGGLVDKNAVDGARSRFEKGDSDSSTLRRPLFRTRKARVGLEIGYDAVAWTAAISISALATRDVPAGSASPLLIALAVLVVWVLSAATGLLGGLYRGRYQRGSFAEVMSVGIAGGLMTMALTAVVSVSLIGQRAPLETVACGALFALPTMAGARYVVCAARQLGRRPSTAETKVVVFGAGQAGTMLISRLLSEPDATYRPVAILDDDPAKRRLRIRGVPVLGDRNQIGEVAAATGASMLVIAIARASGTAIRDLTTRAEQCGLTPKVVPTISELISGSARIEGVRDPRISDLLGRRPVRTDIEAVTERIRGQRILVTGAGGSIGSELCRQLHRLHPAELIMLDRDESALHETQLMLHGRALLDSDETVLADIRDRQRIRDVFEQFRPQIVFHAAALKHLPLLERYPAEAIKSNVWGTQWVLEAAAACGTEMFVNISTDKAADPVSVLGYSKRIAERLTAHTACQASGSYLSVRFGNVLGSRGSVLVALSAQAAAGNPLTVTHPEVTRYFMTGDEAVQLVLQATVIGGSGGVLVLDMGQPVRIADIARRLSARSAYQADIVFTGLRPGEKLTEGLIGQDEVSDRTGHPLIQHVPVAPLSPEKLASLELFSGEASLRASLARCALQMPRLAVPKPANAAGRPVGVTRPP